MLKQSSLLLLTVIQVIIPGSQTNTIQDAPACAVNVASGIADLCRDSEAWRRTCPITCLRLNNDCVPPWKWVGNQCFQVVYEGFKRTWSSARVYCNVEGQDGPDGPNGFGPGSARGDLAVVNGTQQQALYEYMHNTTEIPNGQYWIGGSDLYEPESWYWVNGHNISGHTVSTGRAGECLYIINEPHPIGPITDPVGPIVWPLVGNDGCGATLFFVCEKLWDWIW